MVSVCPYKQVMMKMEQRYPGMPLSARMAVLMGMVAVSIQVSVPLTFGMFRLTACVPASWLESDIAAKAVLGSKVVYNKGL